MKVSCVALGVAAQFQAEMEEKHGLRRSDYLDLLRNAHAEIVEAMALALGGKEAAAHCRHVADRIENVPTMAEVIQKAIDAVRSS